MSLISDFKNIDGHLSMTVVSLFMSLIAPGVLTIYLFLPDLFRELDSFKFILLSVSLSLPAFVTNSLVGFAFDDDHNSRDYHAIGMFGGFLSALVMFLSLLFSYAVSLAFREFLLCIGVIQLFIVIIAYVTLLKERRKARVENS
ncbi:hypothetical protein EDB29_101471 [Vibrio crassostreae]|nr:hypothetical protein EDB29_101471 [Vibrio crassostreae]